MADWRYTHGLHDLGGGTWAWLQPDGGWGWSNAGLIESEGETLLVDTLMGVGLTQGMLAAMKAAVPAAAEIGRLVNTHSNVDHTLGWRDPRSSPHGRRRRRSPPSTRPSWPTWPLGSSAARPATSSWRPWAAASTSPA